MCATCGCSDQSGVTLDGHPHSHTVSHTVSHTASHTVVLEQRVLARNDELAARNREWLAQRRLLAVNLMSSPGSGKTTLLERTIRELSVNVPVAVVEGDQETAFDAQRIRATGCRVVQVNTGAGCHLDADMMAAALRTLDPAPGSIVFVENVGNLVCPALFDLGESSRAVVMSVTEGADKPLKYSHMFRTADVLLLNKIDLLPYVDFDVDRFREYLSRVNPQVTLIEIAATRGDGIPHWTQWLHEQRETLPPPTTGVSSVSAGMSHVSAAPS
jgi:hydrogenase nickel incorporation protein HypB